ncbi:MAG TPA: PAS domain-containing protein [Eudoraea sp.]|nr:PAS domain-containing protein [Eudoraea sp.]
MATVFLNGKLEVEYASDRWMADFDYSERKVIGKPFQTLFKDIGEPWQKAMRRCLKGHKQETGIQDYSGNDNACSYLEWTTLPWYDEKENIIGIIIQTEDVTQRINDELHHEKLKILLKEKSEIAKIGSWEYDATEDTMHWCAMTRRIHEVADDFVPDINEALQFYKEGYSRNTVSMAVYNAMENRMSWSEKLQLLTAKGNEIWVIAAGKPLFRNGKYLGLIGTLQDITEHVKSENKIRESETLLRTVVDSLPLNVYIKDLESRKILANRSECEYMGVENPDVILGKTDFELFDPEIAQISRDEDLYVLNLQKPILGRETLNVKKDGTATTFLTSKIPLNHDDGTAYGLLGISLDITDLKQKEEELRDLINVTSLQNKKLINFAHIVSHNLRSHTANFSMLLDFLVMEKDEAEKGKIIEMLTEASDRLLETIGNLNEVVDISTKTNLEKKPVTINKNIKVVQENLAAFLKTNQATIVNKIPGRAVIKVIPAYLDNILMNFITNAVKYRHPGRKPVIQLSLSRKDDYTILSIEDNGMGIDLNKYGDKLFGMYKTFHDNSDARGIGLYITKNQVDAMNGKIIPISKVGKGTTFNIYFNEKN